MAKKDKPQKDHAADFLLKEVDEEVRAEQLRSWWQRFGSWLVGGAVAIVLATVGHEVWQGHQQSTGEAVAQSLLNAAELADQGRPLDAANTLKSAEAPDSLAPLVQLQAAHYYTTAGKKAEAEALLQEVTEAENMQALQHYARMRLQDNPDTSPQNPFYHTAREMEAIRLAAAGDTQQAHALLQKLVQNPTTPPGIVQRAEQLMRLYHKAEE